MLWFPCAWASATDRSLLFLQADVSSAVTRKHANVYIFKKKSWSQCLCRSQRNKKRHSRGLRYRSDLFNSSNGPVLSRWSVWLSASLLFVGTRRGQVSLRVRVDVFACVCSWKSGEQRGRQWSCVCVCVCACVCGLFTPVLPLEAALADKRSEGDSSIHPSSPSGLAGPSARARRSTARPVGSGQPASLPGNQSRRMSVRTSLRVGLLAWQGPPGE